MAAGAGLLSAAVAVADPLAAQVGACADDAWGEVESLRAAHPHHPWVQLLAGVQAACEQRWDTAQMLLTPLTEHPVLRTSAWENLGAIAAAAGRARDAEHAWRQALAADPGSARARAGLEWLQGRATAKRKQGDAERQAQARADERERASPAAAEARTREARTREARTREARTREARTPEARTPEARTREARTWIDTLAARTPSMSRAEVGPRELPERAPPRLGGGPPPVPSGERQIGDSLAGSGRREAGEDIAPAPGAVAVARALPEHAEPPSPALVKAPPPASPGEQQIGDSLAGSGLREAGEDIAPAPGAVAAAQALPEHAEPPSPALVKAPPPASPGERQIGDSLAGSGRREAGEDVAPAPGAVAAAQAPRERAEVPSSATAAARATPPVSPPAPLPTPPAGSVRFRVLVLGPTSADNATEMLERYREKGLGPVALVSRGPDTGAISFGAFAELANAVRRAGNLRRAGVGVRIVSAEDPVQHQAGE